MASELKTQLFNQHTLKSSLPSSSRRYDTAATVNLSHIPIAGFNPSAPLTINTLPEGWKTHVNPEGKRYYFHEERRIVTETDITNSRLFSLLEHYSDRILQELSSVLPEGCELCIDVDDDERECRHYIADHRQQTIGWADKGLTTKDLGLPTVHSESHLATKKFEEYSIHLEYFPAHCAVSEELDTSVTSQLAYLAVDSLSSRGTTSPYTAAECQGFLKALKYAPKNSAERTWIIGRVSSQLARSRFMNYFGEDIVRLDRTQRIHPQTQPPSWWRTWVSRLFLFNMPLKHQENLEAVWVDRIIYVTWWRQCMQTLINEFRDTLYMSVFVWFASLGSLLLPFNAGISFRISTMVTMVFSFSSAMASAIHIRRHRNRTEDTATDASEYLDAGEHIDYGLQPLSIILSLPSALLTWSLLSCGTSIALLIASIHDTKISAVLLGFCLVMAHLFVVLLRFPQRAP